jgi:tetratricopeptide (TPR) repeat protein
MNFLIFHLKRLIMFPVQLVTSPGEALGKAWTESSRNRSLMLGAPALVVALLAVTAIGGVQLLSQESLEDKYDYLYQKTTADLTQLTKTLTRKQKVQSLDGSTGEAVTEEDRNKLREMQKSQKIYLDKLISLDAENSDYRFELAKMVASRGDRAHAFSILNELAPEDVPGYPRAHFVIAQNYFDKKATGYELLGNLDIALKHVDHVLTRDEEDTQAKLLKAKILTRLQRYSSAYDLYGDLFELNPNYYREMVDLNRKMGREERDRSLYEKALGSFEQFSGKQENQADDRRWIVIETGIAKTLQKLKRFDESEDRLEALIRQYTNDPKGGPRRVFLQRLIADTYIVWAQSIADNSVPYDTLPTEKLDELLKLYTKAYRNHPENVTVLQSLARLSLSPIQSISEQAQAVYDPIADVNAPAPVLNQLGNHALLNKRFSEAIRYYERARGKAPRDSAILNNLSFSYLVAEDNERNAERALQLINEAIRNVPKSIDPVEMSKFLHTKATALKQQDRLQEALAVYERGLKARRDHADTLRSLIECYRGLNKLPPEQYVERLAAIDLQTRQDGE